MELNFENEQEGEDENTEKHMKIPNSDQVFKEQVKLEQIQILKNSIKNNKILIIFLIIFCTLFTAYQLLQDYRISNFQKEIFELKEQIEELQISLKNQKNKKIKNDESNNNKQINIVNNIEEKPQKNNNIINFSAETIVLKDKFEKEIKYLQDCMLETNIKDFPKISNPKISLIIPLYKKESFIHRFIQSIQKQEINELEMIFIQDFSFSNKISKIEEISQIDKRITILKNNETDTLLNSYIKGIKKAKSEYILFLEEDSVLLHNLKDIYDKIIKDNKDINEFSYIKGTPYGITFDEKINNSEKSKQEILESYYDFNFINENPLMNKIFKTKILQNAIKNINQNYLEEKFELHVDSLIYISICSTANSYKSFGDLYISFNLKKTLPKEDIFLEKMFNSSIILANFIYELKQHNIDIFNKRCLLIYNLINWPLSYNRKLKIDFHKTNDAINKYMTNKFISEENIRKLKLLNRKIIDRMKNK